MVDTVLELLLVWHDEISVEDLPQDIRDQYISEHGNINEEGRALVAGYELQRWIKIGSPISIIDIDKTSGVKSKLTFDAGTELRFLMRSANPRTRFPLGVVLNGALVWLGNHRKHELFWKAVEKDVS